MRRPALKMSSFTVKDTVEHEKQKKTIEMLTNDLEKSLAGLTEVLLTNRKEYDNDNPYYLHVDYSEYINQLQRTIGECNRLTNNLTR